MTLQVQLRDHKVRAYTNAMERLIEVADDLRKAGKVEASSTIMSCVARIGTCVSAGVRK